MKAQLPTITIRAHIDQHDNTTRHWLNKLACAYGAKVKIALDLQNTPVAQLDFMNGETVLRSLSGATRFEEIQAALTHCWVEESMGKPGTWPTIRPDSSYQK